MNFERNVAVELFIMGAAHHTHAACADLFNDEIVAGDLANQAWKSCPSACIFRTVYQAGQREDGGVKPESAEREPASKLFRVLTPVILGNSPRLCYAPRIRFRKRKLSCAH
jgi:hypothetical protein